MTADKSASLTPEQKSRIPRCKAYPPATKRSLKGESLLELANDAGIKKLGLSAMCLERSKQVLALKTSRTAAQSANRQQFSLALMIRRKHMRDRADLLFVAVA